MVKLIFFEVALLLVAKMLPLTGSALTAVRSLFASAPQVCPITSWNLLEVELFVESEQACFSICEATKDCNFYRFFNDLSPAKPSQCFMFKTCGRSVVEAGPDCVVNKE